jgi:hypothetical protein
MKREVQMQSGLETLGICPDTLEQRFGVFGDMSRVSGRGSSKP